MTQRRPEKLTAGFVKKVNEPGRYSDGGRGSFGLFLLVRPRAGGGVRRSWGQRLLIDGRPHNLGLGPFPVVSLAEARETAFQNRRAVWQGKDPRDRGDKTVMTFAEATEQLIALRSGGWKQGGGSEQKWRMVLRDYAGSLDSKRVDRITTADVLAILKPIWRTKRPTATVLVHRMGKILEWAAAQGMRNERNPAFDAAKALPKVAAEENHYRAIHHSEVADALEIIKASHASTSSKLALQFLVLTGGRTAEIRGALWDEINLEGRVWSIPRGRMKGGKEHRVALSTGAIAVLEKASELHDGSGLVFPSARKGQPLSESTLGRLLRGHRGQIDASPHGFRSSFKNWTLEQTDTPWAVSEAALAHTLGNATEQAYARTDLFDRRIKLMQSWSDYLGY